MSETKKPPVSLKPCLRCGQFMPVEQGACWICGFPGPPQVIKRQGLSPAWTAIITVMLVLGGIAAIFIAMFVACIALFISAHP